MNFNFSFSNILLWTDGIWGLLTVLFWSITYVFIAIAGFYSKKEKKVSMPYVAGVLNAAWEVAAIIHTGGNPGFIVWFIIDVFIMFWGFCFLTSAKKKILYSVSIFLSTIILLLSFEHLHAVAFLFTVYLIDVIMAVEFILCRKKLSRKFNIAIAAAKLLGDLSAGLTFGYVHDCIIAFSIISFICNFIYLFQCIEDCCKERKKGERLKKRTTNSRKKTKKRRKK